MKTVDSKVDTPNCPKKKGEAKTGKKQVQEDTVAPESSCQNASFFERFGSNGLSRCWHAMGMVS